MGRCAMGLHARIWFTAAQKAELWERWKNGQSAAAISRALERRMVLHGGIAPAPRRRAVAALRLEEREEISRGNCGELVDPADHPGPRTGAIDSKSGDQAQRRPSGLSCKPGRSAYLAASVAP